MYEDSHLEADYEDRFHFEDDSDEEDENPFYDEDDEESEEDIPLKEDELSSFYKEHVAAGMTYLDANYSNHRETVDLNKLDVASLWHCPLAQAANMPYFKTKERETYDLDWYDQHGFDVAGYHEKNALTLAWIDAYQAKPDTV